LLSQPGKYGLRLETPFMQELLSELGGVVTALELDIQPIQQRQELCGRDRHGFGEGGTLYSFRFAQPPFSLFLAKPCHGLWWR
jgi:hypothetical protein